MTVKFNTLIYLVVITGVCVGVSGCGKGGTGGYSNNWLHRQDVATVYVEMFDTGDFRRGHEYVLTDAVCKRIEAQTPYKIVSDRGAADTVLSGKLSVGQGILATERYRGTPLERETFARVSVNWKNLKTGELLINNEEINASATYSSKLSQTFEYGAGVAVNRAAEKIVELMEERW